MTDSILKNLEEERDLLAQELTTVKLVLAGEKGMNQDLQRQIQTMQTYIDTLIEVNDRYAKKIGELKGDLRILIQRK